MKTDLLFYKEYQNFYHMADYSKCFMDYCKHAFGADFSQDGFSDINQIDLIFQYTSLNCDSKILDIGCGNGKMLKYLQSKTDASIYGFDYSENAIKTALSYQQPNATFQVGVIDEIMYPSEHFDLIISMDTMYFTKNTEKLVTKIQNWMKKHGTFFVGYQEGDIMPKTKDYDSTVFAKALKNNNMNYQVINYTKQTYEMLKRKRQSILDLKDAFENENQTEWFNLVMYQTNCVTASYEEYCDNHARYIYIVKKEGDLP